MESNSNNLPAVPVGWTQRELEVLKTTEVVGAKPISATLSSQMFSLFLEGYSCAEIVKQNKFFTEGDILYCRKKYKWDEERDRYAADLNDQIKQKLTKQKLESVEYLTNLLAIIHKESKSAVLKYLQTGNTDDLPAIGSLKTYKDIVETLSKITGEDSVKKIKIDGKITNETTLKADKSLSINPELQTQLLKMLSSQADKNIKVPTEE